MLTAELDGQETWFPDRTICKSVIARYKQRASKVTMHKRIYNNAQVQL